MLLLTVVSYFYGSKLSKKWKLCLKVECAIETSVWKCKKRGKKLVFNADKNQPQQQQTWKPFKIFVVVGKNRWWEVKEEQLITSANDERSERGALLCFLAPLQSFVEARNWINIKASRKMQQQRFETTRLVLNRTLLPVNNDKKKIKK